MARAVGAWPKRGGRNSWGDCPRLVWDGPLALPFGEKTLHRMLSRQGNPTTRNLFTVTKAVSQHWGIRLRSPLAKLPPRISSKK